MALTDRLVEKETLDILQIITLEKDVITEEKSEKEENNDKGKISCSNDNDKEKYAFNQVKHIISLLSGIFSKYRGNSNSNSNKDNNMKLCLENDVNKLV